jgi:DNA polymerase III sliding clamp (beta) subunit (PCNA family)
MDIGFNGAYLRDMFNAMAADVVQMRMADPGSATLFEAVGRKHELFVLMPLHV